MTTPLFARLLAVAVVALAGSTALAAPAELTLYNGQHKQTGLALVDAFEKATGIKVEIRQGSSNQLANQIIAEGSRSPADVFYAEESTPLAALSEHGLLAPLDASTLNQIPKEYTNKAGDWVGVTARTRVVAFNPALIEEKDLPQSVLDFQKPEWQGKIAIVPTSGAFQEQIVAIEHTSGRDTAQAWLTGLKRNAKIYNNNVAALNAVDRGEVAIALINNYYWYGLAKEDGENNIKAKLHYFGHGDPGALITVSGVGVLKSSPHQALAQKFVAFMVSEAGQKAAVAAVAEYPLRPHIRSPFALKPFDQIDPPKVTPADLGSAHDALVLEREAGLN
ncbi:iron ABC transporter substrate-binding protein [Paraburkholderia caballeronis]|uniref:Iron(III) transport system substrate-binding protein n=1 Tax=Paraburkholderia caballeronis TaxID=416943 RepID=A0A1H7MTP2_9BURK|nr:iron ABC transporter substrate-binding protein [Paraburkholderia caballeronis]PXW26440.1 iron(III) transport system substrate-binding protein [Paraburkholderia caballeronis]PXX01987.1 iron(III) transport system substrate-binding protein [Paraburkholderia caballeronis]RAK01144.1 iron(III) transport system substrate-binding protein [Paraburkholderia caballeronis]SEB95533.1 iron(III) transport system substrate-binding protein [Paraburkholderia caballeronis]SEL14168.1 iron(III) transport system